MRTVHGCIALAGVLGLWLTAGGAHAQGAPPARVRVRTYYIAADEVNWDYAPSDSDRIHGVPVPPKKPDEVGNVYRKALYREYTDATFTTLKPRPPEWEHLGFLGPVIRAEVGDSIVVVFRNNASFKASVHPHGVLYGKDSEGAPYADGTSGADKDDDAVPTGGTHTYRWFVPERAGPAMGEGSSVIWMYHSHANEGKDIETGLIGPLIVTARGMARPDGRPKDVDREFVAMFDIEEENRSWLVARNIDEHTAHPATLKALIAPPDTSLSPDEFARRAEQRDIDMNHSAFANSNFLLNINGYIFGNLPGLTMTQGERVRWYVFSSTHFFDTHSPHWHGQTVVSHHMRTDVISLLPMEMLVADMTPDNPGTWLFHCHFFDHSDGGMQALFTVKPKLARVAAP